MSELSLYATQDVEVRAQILSRASPLCSASRSAAKAKGVREEQAPA